MSKLKAEVEFITPDLAREYLKRNQRNRKLSERQVQKLAREMKNGNWVLNYQPIQFDSKGILLNGQHRLNAIIRANVTVQILVIWDVKDPNAFATIDQNSLFRGAHTVLQMKGVQYPTAMTSVSKKLLHWFNVKNKINFSFNLKSYKEISTTDIIEFYEKEEEDIVQVFEMIKDSMILKSCGSPTALITALIICHKANPMIASKFIKYFKSGIDLKEGSPILLLREKLIYSKPKEGGKLRDLEVMALTIKAFNDYSEGKPRKLLRWNQGEKFPTPMKQMNIY